MKQKGGQHWCTALVSEKGDTTQTWKHLDKLLGNSDKNPHLIFCFTANDYHQFLNGKVNAVRERTSNAGPAMFLEHSGSALTLFSAPLITKVMSIVRVSPCKQCQADPTSMWLLKEATEMLAPFLMTLLMTSLSRSEFPSSWKHAAVYPHFKQSRLNEAEISNF